MDKFFQNNVRLLDDELDMMMKKLDEFKLNEMKRNYEIIRYQFFHLTEKFYIKSNENQQDTFYSGDVLGNLERKIKEFQIKLTDLGDAIRSIFED